MKIFYIIFFYLVISLSLEFVNQNGSLNLFTSELKSILKTNNSTRILEEKDKINDSYVIIIESILKLNNIANYLFNIKSMISSAFSKYQNDEHLKVIPEFIEDFIDLNNKYYVDLFNAIEEDKDNILQLLNDGRQKTIVNFLLIILKNDKILDCTMNVLKFYKNLTHSIYILPTIYPNLEIGKDDLDSFHNFINKYYENILVLGYEIIKNINNNMKENYYVIIGRNLENFKNNITIDLLEIIANTNATKIIKSIASNPRVTDICEYIENNPNDFKDFYAICKDNPEILQTIASLLKDLDDKEKIVSILLSQNTIIGNKRLMEIFANIAFVLIPQNQEASNFMDILMEILRGGIKFFFINQEKEIWENISESCREFLNFAFLGDSKFDKEKSKILSSYFLYKFIFYTTKNKNDLVTYEYCLQKPPILKKFEIENIQNFGVVPAYFISSIDKTIGHNKKEFKTGTEFEYNYYIASFCLPLGIKSGNLSEYGTDENKNTYLQCTIQEYNIIIQNLLFLLIESKDADFHSISIRENMTLTENNSLGFVLVKTIPFYLIMLPFIFYVIVILCKKQRDNPRKIEEENKSLVNKEDIQKINNNNKETNLENSKKNNSKKCSKLFLDFIEYFNFKTNFKELFNVNSKVTEYNNVTGLNYVLGLLGISIILTILGQIYLILYNLPMKDFGQSHFYALISGFHYIFFFVGLRYSPRIIFSCSGFILSCKYLNYIEQNNNFLLIKFIYRQFYKYLMLALIFLYNRYSYYFVTSCLFGIKPITELFNSNVLSIPDDTRANFILSLIGFKSFEINKIDSRTRHYLSDFLWMPFNEVFFFLFGTILLYFGYKFKIKIDYLIIALIIILFLGKIPFYVIYFYVKEEIYTTLYYYMFDYGDIMMNPLFNLVYFLIGMYFGLVNYSKEKGIYELCKEKNMYKLFYNDKFEGINEGNYLDEEPNDNDNNNKIEMDINEEKNNTKVPIKTNMIETEKKLKKENEINISNVLKNLDNSKEIKMMPFLKWPIIFKLLHDKWQTKYCYFVLIFLSIIILFLSLSTPIFVYYFGKEIDNEYGEDIQGVIIKNSLTRVITNKLLNYIYLLDIDLVVFFIQWGLFILYTKSSAIIEFFNSNYWSFFNKFYFSFIIVCNSTILYMFYESETVVKINTLTLLMYFFIATMVIFLLTIIFYISIELPLKKIFKNLTKNKKRIINEEDDDDGEDKEECDEEYN